MPRVRSTGTATASATRPDKNAAERDRDERMNGELIAQIGRGVGADRRKSGEPDIELARGQRQIGTVGEHDIDREQHQDAFEIAAHMPRSRRLHPAEQAGRPHEQDEQEKAEDGDIDEVGAEIADREDLGEADDQAADDRAPDVAHAADDHGRDAFEPDGLAHERVHLAIIEREQHAGERGKQVRRRQTRRRQCG